MFWFSAQSCRFASNHPQANYTDWRKCTRSPFPHWSGIGWNGSCITSDVIRWTNASLLALARVPNIAGREPIEAFTPSYLRVRLAVDIHIEVVAEWESETFR